MRRSELSWVVFGMLVLGLAVGFAIGLLVTHAPEREKPEARTVTVPGPERTVTHNVTGPERTVERTVPCKLPDTGGQR